MPGRAAVGIRIAQPEPVNVMQFSLAEIDSLVPSAYAEFRPMIHDGLDFFLTSLSQIRAVEIRARLDSLPPGASPAQRAIVVMYECPTLHKLGQVVARNSNMDPAFRHLLQQLETFAPKVTMEAIEGRLRNDLGNSLERYRLEIDSEPLAEASVAVVIGCRWQTPSGRGPSREGVLKVLKPGIESRLREELAILARLADYLDERRSAYSLSDFRYRETFEAVRTQLESELRLDQEQKNLRAARRTASRVGGAFIPRVLPFSTRTITAMERVPGAQLSEICRKSGTRRYSETLIDALVASVLVSADAQALFHADPHAGNLMTMEDGRIAILDWSLAGRLRRAQREGIARVVLGAVRLDSARIAAALADLSVRTPSLASLDAPIAVALRQVRRGAVPGLSWLMELLDNTAFAGVVYPAELLLFRKAVFVLQGVIHDIDPEASIDRLFSKVLVQRLAGELPRRLRGAGTVEVPIAPGDLLAAYAVLPRTVMTYWAQTLGDLVSAALPSPRIGETPPQGTR